MTAPDAYSEFEVKYLAQVNDDIARYIAKKDVAESKFYIVTVVVLILSIISPFVVLNADGIVTDGFTVPAWPIKLLGFMTTVIVAVGNGLLTFFRWGERWRDASLTYRTITSAKWRYEFEKGDAECGTPQQVKAMADLMTTVETAKVGEWTRFFESLVSKQTSDESAKNP
ncbi:DUF4231 domain-containing protein [Rhizobium ruizarguesonis]|uniref:DUF4231 domain-containing protein n=1 Tax=Rhizobium ruizarguesonis TaxID=2081791 RepID=UPI0013C1610D|nr:DUF4231 domain-containing protein [Rhizobium ruizarguesonis]NEH28150.1 DUF4231 domain-containing protein [Rhizobium ruizarguesonis]NEK07486.1 DUF4231 domain-containing protein [Rhizobium ruizarguesonis]